MPKAKGKNKGGQAAERAAFEWALRALAQPGAVQQELFAGEPAIGQALVDRYQAAYKAFTAAGYGQLSPVQRGRLRTLQAALDDLSQEHNQDFWMDPEALAGDPRWEQVRAHARSVLESFGWSADRPADPH